LQGQDSRQANANPWDTPPCPRSGFAPSANLRLSAVQQRIHRRSGGSGPCLRMVAWRQARISGL